MTSAAEPPPETRQDVHVEDSAVAFTQGTGTQNNYVTHNHVVYNGAPPSNPEGLYRQGKAKLGAGDEEGELLIVAAAEAGHVEAVKEMRKLSALRWAYLSEERDRWNLKLIELGVPEGYSDLAACKKLRMDDAETIEERVPLYREAIAYYEKAIDVGLEGDTEDLGMLLYDAGNYEEAIPYLERAITYIKDEGDFEWRDVESTLRSARKKLQSERRKAERDQQGGSVERGWWRRRG
ncbi:tetratricopeptide repeat protein [Streptomyces sp. NPDC051364]|uniref:tetratricopeptide repeat protein n=1 Tax=Streptomyces sp. NPDC051364 TaxID=3155799 RepID=UPI003431FD16